MLTVKAEVKKNEIRKDGTYNVKVRFTLDRKVRRVSTSLFASPVDLNRMGKLKQGTVLYREVEKLVLHYKQEAMAMQVDAMGYDLDTIVERLLHKEEKSVSLDFIAFSERWIKDTKIKGAKNYACAINSFREFLQGKDVDARKMTVQMLRDYKEFLDRKREERVRILTSKGKRVTSDRSVSLYLGSLRHLFKVMQLEYNKEEEGVLPLPYSPFTRFSVPRQEMTRKRALAVEKIREIYELPYIESSYKGNNRRNLAKDCFLLSFCLMGMNSVDLYNVTEMKGDTIIYNRTKTKDRRMDAARMEVRIPELIMPIVQKYKDRTGKRIFCFHKYYSDYASFNKALNIGLKEIGKELGVEDLEFYAARHSWATIALNKVGIDKYVVHSALNHVDPSMRVTDIYIEKDFVAENMANQKVIDYVFGLREPLGLLSGQVT